MEEGAEIALSGRAWQRQLVWCFLAVALLAAPPEAQNAQDAQVLTGSRIRLLHITDSHISLVNEVPARSGRMYSAFVRTKHRDTKAQTTPQDEFERLLQITQSRQIDLVVLGGDIMNFPSNQTVAWVMEQLRLSGTDFIFTSGNHDWLLEGQRSAPSYDAARFEELSSTFRPFYEHSLTSGGSCYAALGQWSRPGAGIMYGCAVVKGLLLVFVDNSNFQVDEDQLEFLRLQLASVERSTPVALVLHIPFLLPGLSLPPKETCAHPQWGSATDQLWQLEGRPKWPESNSPTTLEFKNLVQDHAYPQGQIVAVLSGHAHIDSAVALGNSEEFTCAVGMSCSEFVVESEGGREAVAQASGALQYITGTASEGAYRILTIHTMIP